MRTATKISKLEGLAQEAEIDQGSGYKLELTGATCHLERGQEKP